MNDSHFHLSNVINEGSSEEIQLKIKQILFHSMIEFGSLATFSILFWFWINWRFTPILIVLPFLASSILLFIYYLWIELKGALPYRLMKEVIEQGLIIFFYVLIIRFMYLLNYYFQFISIFISVLVLL